MVDIGQVREMLGNNNLIVLPFHRSHIDRLGLAEYDAMSIETLESKEMLFQGMEDSEYSYTVFYNLQPMLSFGVDVKWTGVAEAWMFTGTLGRKHGIILSRGARRFFDKIGPALNLHRLQIVVSVERSDAVNWARFLDFEEEGRLKSYGPEGADYLMFARVYT